MLYIFLIQLKFFTSAHAACVKDPVELYRWDGSTSTPVIITNDYTMLNKTGRTYFTVHGWIENGTQAEYRQIAVNYYEMDPTCNVILVDYRGLAQESYLEARSIVTVAGTAFGNRIVSMLKQNIIILTNMQMFGHSLGTHVRGQAAKIIKAGMDGQRVPRVTASDPAGPLFRLPIGIGLLDPLSTMDTDMLDITHTSYTMGTLEPFGDVDTYVDFLHGNQPGCDGQLTEDALLFCNHRLARAYFTESIRTSVACKFQQHKLTDLLDSNTIVYGQHMPLSARGIYTMSVSANPPYALGTQNCQTDNN